MSDRKRVKASTPPPEGERAKPRVKGNGAPAGERAQSRAKAKTEAPAPAKAKTEAPAPAKKTAAKKTAK